MRSVGTGCEITHELSIIYCITAVVLVQLVTAVQQSTLCLLAAECTGVKVAQADNTATE